MTDNELNAWKDKIASRAMKAIDDKNVEDMQSIITEAARRLKSEPLSHHIIVYTQAKLLAEISLDIILQDAGISHDGVT